MPTSISSPYSSPMFYPFSNTEFVLGSLYVNVYFPNRKQLNNLPNTIMNKLATILLAAVLLTFGTNTLSAQTQTAPKSVIHVVTVKWKADATPKQIQEALDGVRALPAAYSGITRVWIKSIKVQS